MIGRKIVGQRLPAPNKLRPSDVIGIPLNQSEWGYARVLRGAGMAILCLRSQGLYQLDDVIGSPVAFFVEYFEPYDVSPWIYLGKWRFESDGDAWGPPTFFRDHTARGVITLLSKGTVTRGVAEHEIAGLSQQQLLPPDKIREMILSKVLGGSEKGQPKGSNPNS
jgi:hypothetical protein